MTGAAGVILGTAAYMSPEQAKGKPVDKRTDIWAFGCVLYEMFAGRRAFEGEDVSDTLAAVLRAEPDWTGLPRELPEHVRLLMRRCLEKDRTRRVSDISVARFLLTEPVALAAPTAAGARHERPRPLWQRAALPIAATIAGAVLSALAVSRLQTTPASPVIRFTNQLQTGELFTNTNRRFLTISDDGSQLAYTANYRLQVKRLSEPRPTAIVIGNPSEGLNITNPVFSPDGRSIVYWSGGGAAVGGGGILRKVPTGGGPAVTLCAATNPTGVSWNGNDIWFSQVGRGILRVSAAGGTAEVVVPYKNNELSGPQMLPGDRFLLYAVSASDWSNSEIVVQEIGSSEVKSIVRDGVEPRYVATGHIVYAQRGLLMAAPFDLTRMEVTGESVAVVEGIRRASVASTAPAAQVAVSKTGTLAYMPGSPTLASANLDVAMLDFKDTIARVNLPPNEYEFPRFSPDGSYLAVGTDGGTNISIYDLSGSSQLRRLTFGGRNRLPAWTADGSRVTFQSDRDGDRAIFSQRADGTGTAERLTKPEKGQAHWPYDWSPSGETMLYRDSARCDVPHYRTFSLKTGKSEPYGGVRSSGVIGAAFAPDGKWVAYSTTERGGSVDGIRAAVSIDRHTVPDSKRAQSILEHGWWNPVLLARSSARVSRSCDTHTACVHIFEAHNDTEDECAVTLRLSRQLRHRPQGRSICHHRRCHRRRRHRGPEHRGRPELVRGTETTRTRTRD